MREHEKEKAEVEKKESNKVAKSGGAGKLGILVGLTKGRLAEVRAALGRLKQQRDAYVSRVDELEEILKTFKEEYNPNFNDEGVKRAVRAWDDYAAKEKEMPYEQYDTAEQDLLVMDVPESDGIDWEDFEKEQEVPNDDVAARKSTFALLLPVAIRLTQTQSTICHHISHPPSALGSQIKPPPSVISSSRTASSHPGLPSATSPKAKPFAKPASASPPPSNS